MKTKYRWKNGWVPFAIIMLLFALTAAGCGGDGGSSPKTTPPGQTPVIGISISPTTMNIGETRTLNVTRTNTNDFTLSVSPSTGHGCLKSGSNAVVCTPTVAGTYTVTVTATADVTKSASAMLTVVSPAPLVSISISPTTARIRAGQTVKLTVTTQNTGINWPAASGAAGSFTTSGNEVTWTPPSVVGTYNFTVTAAADTSKKATAQVTVFIPSEYPVDTLYSGINNSGKIAGSGFYSDGTVRAFVKDGDNWDIFDHPDAYDYTYAVGINDSGSVLGYYENGYFLKTGSSYQAIAGYQGYSTGYTGINNDGRLSGNFTDSGGHVTGFIKTGSSFSLIEHPSSSSSACVYGMPCGTWVTGINNDGHVSGVYTDSDGIYRSFLYNGVVYTAIDHPDSSPSNRIYAWVNGINDYDEAVGYFWKPAESGNPGHGFVYDGVFEVFDHPGASAGGEGTYILGINNAGRTVGWFDDGEKAVGFTGDL